MAGPSGYLDMDMVVTQRGDLLETRVLDSPAGETGTVTALMPLAASGDNRHVGDALFEAVFSGEVLRRYQRSTDAASGSGLGLRIVLRFDGGADQLPWELLRDPGRRRFMGLDPWRSVIRCTEMQARHPSSGSPTPLRILLAVSTPDGTPALDAALEIARIRSRLLVHSASAAIEVLTLRTASLESIRRTMASQDFHVFHYIGHASHPAGGTGHLDLTAVDGTVSSRPAEEVAAILAGSPTLRLAVLNCCDSAVSDGRDPFAGTAAALVKGGVPAVVAMRRAITDTAAVIFADEFYGALVRSGGRVEEAVTSGRAALLASDGPTSAEWSTVALHLGSSLGADYARVPVPGLDHDVRFTVSHPAQLRPTVWEPLLFFAHHGDPQMTESGRLVDQSAQVHERVASFFGEAASATTATPSTRPVPRGAALVVRPDLPGIECDPHQASVTWAGEIAQLTFLLRAPSALGTSTVRGQVRVFSGPLVVAEAAVTLPVGTVASAPPAASRDASVHRYERIFPCYAPADADLVEGVVAVAEALGDTYLAEVVQERRSGAPLGWMRARISEADSFQLFWSSRSMTSATCRSEWEDALALARDGFVRPLYWEEPFPRSAGLPPPELTALRFVRLPVPSATVSGDLWGEGPPAPPAPDAGVSSPSVVLSADVQAHASTRPRHVGPTDDEWAFGPSVEREARPPRSPARGAPAAGALTGLTLIGIGLLGGGPSMAAAPGYTSYGWGWLVAVGVLVLAFSLVGLARRR